MVPPTPIGRNGPSSNPLCPLGAGIDFSIYDGTNELSEWYKKYPAPG